MPTVPVLTYDTASAPTRLGGSTATLNVNSGSQVSGTNYNPELFVSGAGSLKLGHRFLDMCFGPSGELWVVHTERDINDSLTPNRGPYVHRFTGGAWSQVGGEIDTNAGTPGTGGGGASYVNKVHPSIACDGTSVWVSWWEVGHDAAILTLSCKPFVAKWNGSSWAMVGLSGGFVLASTAATALPLKSALVASSGQAWVAYQDGSDIVSYLDDGTLLPIAWSDAEPGNIAGITGRDGSPLAVYTSTSFEVVLINLHTQAVLRRTPAARIVPYGVDQDPGFVGGTLNACLYGTDEIVVTDGSHGPLAVKEDGSADFYVLGGADNFISYLTSAVGIGYRAYSGIAQDTIDPFTLWEVGNSGTNDLTLLNTPSSLSNWAPACTTAKVAPNPDNPVPARIWRNQGTSIVPYISDPSVYGTTVADTQLGTPVMLSQGNHLYVGFTYAPTAAGSALAEQVQFAVYDFPICRGCGACTVPTVPVLRNRFPADGVPAGGATPANSTSSTKVFEPTKGFPVG